jgi:hypothetical protein
VQCEEGVGHQAVEFATRLRRPLTVVAVPAAQLLECRAVERRVSTQVNEAEDHGHKSAEQGLDLHTEYTAKLKPAPTSARNVAITYHVRLADACCGCICRPWRWRRQRQQLAHYAQRRGSRWRRLADRGGADRRDAHTQRLTLRERGLHHELHCRRLAGLATVHVVMHARWHAAQCVCDGVASLPVRSTATTDGASEAVCHTRTPGTSMHRCTHHDAAVG